MNFPAGASCINLHWWSCRTRAPVVMAPRRENLTRVESCQVWSAGSPRTTVHASFRSRPPCVRAWGSGRHPALTHSARRRQFSHTNYTSPLLCNTARRVSRQLNCPRRYVTFRKAVTILLPVGYRDNAMAGLQFGSGEITLSSRSLRQIRRSAWSRASWWTSGDKQVKVVTSQAWWESGWSDLGIK